MLGATFSPASPLKAGASLLRAAVMGLAALVMCWPLTTALGLLAALLAAAAGTLVGTALSRTRLRTPALLGLLALMVLLGVGISRLMVDVSLLASAFGPLRALSLAEAVQWFAVVLPAATALRLMAERSPAMAVFEVVAVGAALAGSVAAHREGMVTRPFAVADPIWSRGGDTVVVFLLLGGLFSLMLAAMLIKEDRKRRLPLHFMGLAALAVLLLFIVKLTGPPEPRAAGDLGLTGKPKDKQGQGQGREGEGGPGGQQPGEGGGQGGQGQDEKSQTRPQDQEDLPFKNEYSSRGGDAPVAVVLLHDDYSPPAGLYYFRQTAFSQFNGVRLVEATRDDVDRDVFDSFPAARIAVQGAPAVSAERVSLTTTVGLLAEHVKPFALDSPAFLWPTANPDPMRFRRAYGAESRVPTLPYPQMLGHKPGRADWSEAQWAHYTDYPRRDARYLQLANQIVLGLKEQFRSDPLAQAVAVKGYLDKNGIYSRKSNHAGNEDPTADFLFGDLTGYCVHFAHAAAFLLRARGVPARVAGGYAIEESRRAGGSAIMIRGKDGHAWPEIYIEDVGWVVVDISPERSLEPPGDPADSQLQQMLGQMLRKQPKNPQEAEGRDSQLPSAGQIAAALGWLLLAALLCTYSVKLYRALAPGLVAPPQVYRVGYRAALDRFSDVGLRRGFGETREAFAERVQRLSPSFVGLTWGHLGDALGSARPAEPEQLRRLAAEVGSEIRSSVPRWRWALGLLNPFSVLLSR